MNVLKFWVLSIRKIFLFPCSSYLYETMNVNYTCGHHWMTHVSKIIMLYTLNLYWSEVQVTQSCSTPFPFPGNLPKPGIKPRSPALQADSLPSEPQGKTNNTGVGSLSLLKWIFPTQESTWGLLHWRQILYQLSYQESPPNLYNYVSIIS